MIVELLDGALGGEGCAAGLVRMKSNGVLLNVYNIEHFTSLEAYYSEVETLIDHIHTRRVDPDVGEILLPGEPEFLRRGRKRPTASPSTPPPGRGFAPPRNALGWTPTTCRKFPPQRYKPAVGAHLGLLSDAFLRIGCRRWCRLAVLPFKESFQILEDDPQLLACLFQTQLAAIGAHDAV